MFPDKSLPRQFAISWDPSDYGGKSTMVNTIYSVVADCAAFMPNQRIRRLILADLHDSFIEEAKASKLGTLEGYSEVRALSHALLQATGCSLMDFRVPETLLARPLQDGEARIFINGAWYIVGPGDLVRPELPPGLDISSIPALVSCSDQGPSNTSSLNFLMFGQERLMVQVQYDCFHRGWNDVKLSAKRALGHPWKTMLQLVPLFNMNYAPFQSSAFFYKKQAVLENFLGTRTYKDPSFQAAIPMICKERRISERECAEEEQELFRSLAHMGNSQKKGSLIKLLRWMSFFEVALEWKGDMWATKLILESDLKEADSLDQGLAVDLPKPIQQQQQEPEKEQSNLDAKKEINELRKAAGTWKLAPKMVSQKNISTLDMLLLVCRATWKCHAERARIIVSPPQVLQHNLACSQAAFWAFELEEMVASALWKKQELRMMHPMDQDNQQLLLEHSVFFTICSAAGPHPLLLPTPCNQ